MLLRDLLKSSPDNAICEKKDVPQSRAALQDAGVYRLTPDEALKVLNLRVRFIWDLAAVKRISRGEQD